MLLRRMQEMLTKGGFGRWSEPLEDSQPNGGQWLYHSLRVSQRFLLSEMALEAASQVATDIDRLRKARAKLFAPFPYTWVEFPGGSEVTKAFLWVGKRDGGLRHGHLLYMEWQDNQSAPQIAFLAVDLDTEPWVMVDPDVGRAFAQMARRNPQDAAWMTTPEQMRIAAIPAADTLLACWALLASKGMTRTVEADYTKLNKQRAKKGLYPLLGFSEIRLNIDAERVVRAKHATATGHMPLHPVRAHLRLLPTGKVVIVRAHMRGNPEYGVRSHHYTVMTDEDEA